MKITFKKSRFDRIKDLPAATVVERLNENYKDKNIDMQVSMIDEETLQLEGKAVVELVRKAIAILKEEFKPQ